MALHLNLLHEEIFEQRQRQRDPLKIGIMVLAAIGTLMVLFYMWKAYQTLEIKNRLAAVQRDWAKVEPEVTAAQKRSAELNGIISTTKVLDSMVESRFFWAPLLQTLSRCVAPNAQLTSIDGAVNDDSKLVTVTMEGIAAGREPRSAAEELRQLLSEQLGQNYPDVKVEFKTLEDLDTIVNVAGANMAMARYIITVTFAPPNSEPAKAPTPRAPKK
ncbi:MAG: PilN domain-containing protein [Chthoniobacterales bacterium]